MNGTNSSSLWVLFIHGETVISDHFYEMPSTKEKPFVRLWNELGNCSQIACSHERVLILYFAPVESHYASRVLEEVPLAHTKTNRMRCRNVVAVLLLSVFSTVLRSNAHQVRLKMWQACGHPSSLVLTRLPLP